MKLGVRLVFAFAALAASACGKQRARDELARARTPAEEARALDHLAEACQPVSLSVEDASGRALPVSSARFPAEAAKVLIRGPCSIDHRLLEPKNVLRLMNE